MNSRVNSEEPQNDFFQVMTVIIRIDIEGIVWIVNPIIFFQKGAGILKTSKANTLRKRASEIAIKRGNQKSIVFIILIFSGKIILS